MPKSPKRYRRAMPLIVLPLLILTACGPQTQTLGIKTQIVAAPPADACKVFKLIVFSRLHDTAETIRQVKAHNARWESLCGKSAGLPVKP